MAGIVLLAACAGPVGTRTPGPRFDDAGRNDARHDGLVTDARPRDADPLDVLPVARFTSLAAVDDLSRCIGERWARLSVFAPGKVTLHPGWRGLIVDVKTARDPLARAYVEIYPAAGVTHADYFVRSFVSDPDEDLRRRALQSCF
ncbi:hypothetical protein OVY01_15600 [Robbsia sp. Bb-Pol-6]|uniref:Lipoprotein n=1 Tax=Robbsia betulipollinis TaxID=2981849 RepID=A0ABT3ZQQ9_9BURK|nr:hypothetical protein [Robbsia betulipollinis]MCY0388607.1 hypothetical protein [Robbsia betulipollinis]